MRTRAHRAVAVRFHSQRVADAMRSRAREAWAVNDAGCPNICPAHDAKGRGTSLETRPHSATFERTFDDARARRGARVVFCVRRRVARCAQA